MFPYFTLFGKTFGMYGICTAVGILFMGLLAFRLAKKRSLYADGTIIMMLVSFGGSFIGAHLLYGITNLSKIIELFRHFSDVSASEFFTVFAACFGGMVYYGGLIGALTAGFIYMKAKKMNISDYSDAFAPGVPLFHAFARIGCFLGGCCYGIESSFGVVFTHALSPEANGVRRFPVQLLESGINLAIFAVLLILFLKKKQRGNLMLIYLIIYPVSRFLLEFLRGDEIRGFIFGISTSQAVSIVLFVLAVVMLIIKRNKSGRGAPMCAPDEK